MAPKAQVCQVNGGDRIQTCPAQSLPTLPSLHKEEAVATGKVVTPGKVHSQAAEFQTRMRSVGAREGPLCIVQRSPGCSVTK